MDKTVNKTRVRLTGVSSRAWEHPADKGALVALRQLRGFDFILRKLAGLWNERALRLMLIHSLQRGLDGGDGLPSRQNRRTPLIEAALAPARGAFSTPDRDLLVKALGLVIGTESMIAFKDVQGLDDVEADAVRRWMIRTLVAAAGARAAT